MDFCTYLHGFKWKATVLWIICQVICNIEIRGSNRGTKHSVYTTIHYSKDRAPIPRLFYHVTYGS